MYRIVSIRTNGHSNGGNGPCRSCMMPLLCGIGCIQRAQTLDEFILQGVSGTCRRRGDLDPFGFLGLHESTPQTAYLWFGCFCTMHLPAQDTDRAA